MNWYYTHIIIHFLQECGTVLDGQPLTVDRKYFAPSLDGFVIITNEALVIRINILETFCVI